MTSFKPVTGLQELESIYGAPGEASLLKIADRITPEYRALLEASPFFALATVGPARIDCSPRGELGGAFRIADEKTLIIPDWRGNNRIDSLRNIVRDPRVALLLLIPGSQTTIRMNGTAIVTVDEGLLASFERDGKRPRSAVIVSVNEVYTQCGRAVLRAELWNPAHHVYPKELPTPGDVLRAQSRGVFDSETYDREWAGRAEKTMW
ncbi:pyridoxamine 5'-phosphate oxidase family protein [Oricola cellulosilytica]|uniref:Pyridoxamine 5'-phosphate oxidase family protein n=1 Tax=Oricola cellulosilytica TaxID=1429082 RepID=A0A4R0P4I4_9HYPH|nr:pyridoxamine 5'-phosphate oxidase family protein [Oricola cellulosilytica]TCD11811.1 pyridoxamine 5'-phosphate oxidase family protein [Oricola cellulosilytica]